MKQNKTFHDGGMVAWIALGIGALFIVSLLVYNATHKEPNIHTSSEPWNKAMTEGKMDAPNRIVEYTDYFCPYCTAFSEQTFSQRFQDEFIKNGKVRLEARVVAILAQSGFSPNAEQGAGSAYCAADQNKFWEYSADIVPRIKKDFFDKGIGTKSVAVPKAIEKQPLSYFEESAVNAKLDVDTFITCMSEKKYQKELDENTAKASRLGVRGLPHIVINDYTANGFQGGWSSIESMMLAGGVE